MLDPTPPSWSVPFPFAVVPSTILPSAGMVSELPVSIVNKPMPLCPMLTTGAAPAPTKLMLDASDM